MSVSRPSIREPIDAAAGVLAAEAPQAIELPRERKAAPIVAAVTG
jgi:hypothetical protein